MDSFDWNELLKAVEELGHGAVRFQLHSGDLVELKIDTIVINENEGEAIVTMEVA